MEQTVSYALFDSSDNIFITVKHPSIHNALEWRREFINNTYILVFKVVGTTITDEISVASGKPVVSSLDITFVQSKYLPLKSAKF
jgi:ketopantoate reductase